jgi:hypothetical protein
MLNMVARENHSNQTTGMIADVRAPQAKRIT